MEIKELAYLCIIAGVAFGIMYVYWKYRGNKIRLELIELNDKLIEMQDTLIKAVTLVQDSLDNHIIIKLTSVYINTIILSNSAAYSRMFLAFLKTVDMEQIARYYKILSTSKTFATAHDRAGRFSGNLMSADIALLEQSFSYISKKKPDDELVAEGVKEEFVLKSYPRSFLDKLESINEKIDGELLADLKMHGTARMEPPVLKETVVGLYARKLNQYQKAFLKMEPMLREDYTSAATLSKLLEENDYDQLFERLDEMELNQHEYYQLVQIKNAYNSLHQAKLEYSEDFVETQKRRISAQLLHLIKLLNEDRKTNRISKSPPQGD